MSAARHTTAAAVFLIVLGCTGPTAADDYEAISMFGEPLVPRPLAGDRLARVTRELEEASAQLAANPADPDALIWVGRRQAYLGRYRQAIATYTSGLAIHPDEPRLLRHRGHRFISTRRLGDAVRDLSRAAELSSGKPDRIEPDGMPNARGIPTSTTQSNIYYHLGLAHFLLGEYERAAAAYERCRAVCRTDDMMVATVNWQALTLRRLGRVGEMRAAMQAVDDNVEVIENHAYLKLVRLQQGRIEVDELLREVNSESDITKRATMAFGVAAWLDDRGNRARAIELYHRILNSPQWAAFGYIAAEAELYRRRLGR